MIPFKETRRRWQLQRKSVITPPARKVICKPLTKIIVCPSDGYKDINIKELNDFVFDEGYNKKLKENIPFHIIKDKGIQESLLSRVAEFKGDEFNIKININEFNLVNECEVIFTFTEKQKTPGFRIMKFSKKSRFHPDNLCKTN